jgi:hypothetical protein
MLQSSSFSGNSAMAKAKQLSLDTDAQSKGDKLLASGLL